MNIGIYQAVSGMRANEAYQDVISGNLSRMMAPGARAGFEVYLQKPEDGAPVRTQTHFSFEQGALSKTDGAFDFAIIGDGFFRVREADGGDSFTRNGQFQVLSNGGLYTSDGAEVLGGDGKPFRIPNLQSVDGDAAQMRADGVLMVDGVEYGQLGLAHFESPEKVLQPGIHGRFQVGDVKLIQEGLAQGDEVKQYHLELSNINAVEQMVNMIQVNRAFEASQRAVRSEDEAMGKLLDLVK